MQPLVLLLMLYWHSFASFFGLQSPSAVSEPLTPWQLASLSRGYLGVVLGRMALAQNFFR